MPSLKVLQLKTQYNKRGKESQVTLFLKKNFNLTFLVTDRSIPIMIFSLFNGKYLV